MAVAVKQDQDREASRRALDALTALVADDLKQVNALILDRMQSDVGLVPQLAGHIIAAGGKRMRPVLTLAAAKLCDYTGTRQISLAAAVEFIHTATLLHDDVVDESGLRRGRATANAVWGNKPSVLVGDFLFSRAFQCMVEDGSLDVLRILANASAVIAEGEVLQLTTANDIETGEEAYLRVIRAKTAALFAAATRIGAVVAGRPREEEEALETYGLNLGIAFQLVDDVLDYASAAKTMGKSVGDDFADGKITLPVILALRRSDEEEREFWRRTLEDQEIGEGDLEYAIEIMERHGSLRESLDRARDYAGTARAALNRFADTPVRRALADLVQFAVDRAF